ncbi:bifunctional 2',3'-cyclic-nucleotide 2'-phosphodiesterase/3'-nucleotidase [Pelagibius litoralis]|uniref:Bifunctional 2',3'-cyclic-nucleotide 2'-phosphodiesterase/3'-nucleotidase n=2 Tax=Pelagibius litoralis TaxID=374515 RepID=A0A967C3L3_9PROT|nr:bifunctional 2',3'-cyclic-nucleotide 2'-phosphodiesterase/3'-nucleotidase [Pelagibius litoralis]
MSPAASPAVASPIAVFALLGFALIAAGAAEAADKVKLRLMETADIHMHIVDYDYYRDSQSDTVGLAKVSSLVKAARAEVKNSLFFDNGDLIQGNPLGDYMAQRRGLKAGETHPIYKAMNLLDYDAGNIGNHEFNYGLDFLMKTIAGADFPYTLSNVYLLDDDSDPDNDKPLFTPYLILDRELEAEGGARHAIKVGVIGFTPPQIMLWDKTNLEGRLRVEDIVDSAEKYIPQMRAAGADIVVALPHSSISPNPRKAMAENAVYHLTEVEGIDAILFGHGHSEFPSAKFEGFPNADLAKGTVNGVPAVMPGFWGSHLGVVDLDLEVADGRWSVVDGRGSLRAIYKREGRKRIPLVEADKAIVDAVREEHQATIDYMNEGVGETTAAINSYFALVADDPSIQIVTNAQKWYVEKIVQGTEYEGIPILSAGAPFKAGGRQGADYYTVLEPGDIALKNVADLYIYPNTLRVVKLNGTEVREWLEMSAGQFNRIDPTAAGEQELVNTSFPSYNFDVIDGVTYQIDVTKPARYNKDGEIVSQDHRIVGLTFEDKPVTEEMEFLVATNNYRAGGGGNFPGLDGASIIIEAPDENRTVLANYIFDQKAINPAADNNWSFAPLGGEAKVTFTSSPAAREAAEELGFTLLGDAEGGFAIYVIDLE